MIIDLKKTLDNSKRNITKASIARHVVRTWQTIQNYYTGATKTPRDVNTALIEFFEENGDEVFYKKEL